jgi:hypothetical protein
MTALFGRSVGMTMLARLTLVALLALVAGCGSDEPSAPATLGEPISYEVIGGDAFRDDEITVETDGRASVPTRSGTRSATLTPAERTALARDIEAANLADAESAVTDPPIPDALSYRFSYRGHQVTTDTGKLPDDLRGLVGTFNELIERYGA